MLGWSQALLWVKSKCIIADVTPVRSQVLYSGYLY